MYTTITRTFASTLTCLSHLHRLGLLILLVAGCASTRPPPGVTAVTSFDVQRYVGRSISRDSGNKIRFLVGSAASSTGVWMPLGFARLGTVRKDCPMSGH